MRPLGRRHRRLHPKEDEEVIGLREATEAVREASELGFSPGRWPHAFKFEGKTMVKAFYRIDQDIMVYTERQTPSGKTQFQLLVISD